MILLGGGGAAAAQTGPRKGHIEVTGSIQRTGDASSRFYFATPTQLEIRLNAPMPGNRVLVIWLQRSGASFPRAGRYQVGRGRGYEPPADSSVFQVHLQDEKRWIMDSGSVTIESADTVQVTGRLSASGALMEGAGRVRVEASFTSRYDGMSTRMRQVASGQAEPHPPSLGLPPSRKPRPPAVSPPGTPIKVIVILEPGVEARFDTLRFPAEPKGGKTRQFVLDRRSGDTLNFEVKAGAEYKNALATVADTVTAAKGAVVLRGSTAIIASADRDVRLKAANRAMYDLFRESLTTTDPVGVANRMMCETDRMMTVHGDSARELIAEAEFLAIDPLRDEAAVNRFDRALGGRTFTIDRCSDSTPAPKP